MEPESELPKPEIKLANPNAKEVQEFKRLYKERFNVEITDEEAQETATAYLHMFQLLTWESEGDSHVS
jgi:hypothetical protein